MQIDLSGTRIHIDGTDTVVWNINDADEDPTVSERIYWTPRFQIVSKYLGYVFRFVTSTAGNGFHCDSLLFSVEVQVPYPNFLSLARANNSSTRAEDVSNVWVLLCTGLKETQSLLFVRRFATLLRGQVSAIRNYCGNQSDEGLFTDWLRNPSAIPCEADSDKLPSGTIHDYDRMWRTESEYDSSTVEEWPFIGLGYLVQSCSPDKKRSEVENSLKDLQVPSTLLKSVLNTNTCNGRRKSSKGKYLLSSSWRQVECQTALVEVYRKQQRSPSAWPSVAPSTSSHQQGHPQAPHSRQAGSQHCAVGDSPNDSTTQTIGKCIHCSQPVGSGSVKAIWSPLMGSGSYTLHLHLVLHLSAPENGEVVAVKGIKLVPVLLEPQRKARNAVVDSSARMCSSCVSANTALHLALDDRPTRVQGVAPYPRQPQQAGTQGETALQDEGNSEMKKLLQFLRKERNRRRLKIQRKSNGEPMGDEESARFLSAQITQLTHELDRALRHVVHAGTLGESQTEFSELLQYCSDSGKASTETVVPNALIYLLSRYLQSSHLANWQTQILQQKQPVVIEQGVQVREVGVEEVVNQLSQNASPLWLFIVSLTLARRKNVEISRFNYVKGTPNETRGTVNRYLSSRARQRIEVLQKLSLLHNEKSRTILVSETAGRTSQTKVLDLQQTSSSRQRLENQTAGDQPPQDFSLFGASDGPVGRHVAENLHSENLRQQGDNSGFQPPQSQTNEAGETLKYSEVPVQEKQVPPGSFVQEQDSFQSAQDQARQLTPGFQLNSKQDHSSGGGVDVQDDERLSEHDSDNPAENTELDRESQEDITATATVEQNICSDPQSIEGEQQHPNLNNKAKNIGGNHPNMKDCGSEIPQVDASAISNSDQVESHVNSMEISRTSKRQRLL